MKADPFRLAFAVGVVALASFVTACSASTCDGGGGADAVITLAANWDDPINRSLNYHEALEDHEEE